MVHDTVSKQVTRLPNKLVKLIANQIAPVPLHKRHTSNADLCDVPSAKGG